MIRTVGQLIDDLSCFNRGTPVNATVCPIDGVQQDIKDVYADGHGVIIEVADDIVEVKPLFDDCFIPKIKEGRKVITVRNKPIALGIYSLADDLNIEIYKCIKVGVSFHKYMGHDDIEFFDINTYPSISSSIESKFGFENKQTMVEFYRQYLKSNEAYKMWFRVLERK